MDSLQQKRFSGSLRGGNRGGRGHGRKLAASGNNLSSKDVSGIYHLTANGKASWYDFATYVIFEAKKSGGVFLTNPENIIAINASEYVLPAKRPVNSLLDTQKLCKTFNLQLPVWQIHADRVIKELYLREA